MLGGTSIFRYASQNEFSTAMFALRGNARQVTFFIPNGGTAGRDAELNLLGLVYFGASAFMPAFP
jgi:hypothetical protein